MARVDLVAQGFTIRSDQTRLGLSTVALVRGERTTVVDAGTYGRRAWIIEGLRALGVAPEDVDGLAFTHLHWDHMQNLDLFPNATIYLHPAELAYMRDRGDWATMRYLGPVLAEREVREVEEGYAVEPGVTIIDTPGHTGGSMSVLVDTPEGTVGIVGDALPNARTALRRKPYLVFGDERAAEASGEKIASRCQILYCGHDRPFRFVPGEQRVEYLVPASIKFQVGFEPGSADQAVTLTAEPPTPLHVVSPDGQGGRTVPWALV
jgi:glyoxylase-like metal-dependent hydrolase (beta-lactamase superfamily II)